MKTRTGFVSNSSSSSFIVGLSDITDEQRYKIIHHTEIAEEMPHDFGHTGCPWTIDTYKDYIRGHTSMDNFYMRDFMETIGVDMDKVHWEHG